MANVFTKADVFLSTGNAGASVSFIYQIPNTPLADVLAQGQYLARAMLYVAAGNVHCDGIRVSNMGVYKDSLVDSYNLAYPHGGTERAGELDVCLLGRLQFQNGLGRSMKAFPFPPAIAYDGDAYQGDLKWDGSTVDTWRKKMQGQLVNNWGIWALDRDQTSNPEVQVKGVTQTAGALLTTVITRQPVTVVAGQKIRIRNAKCTSGFINGLWEVASIVADGGGGSAIILQNYPPGQVVVYSAGGFVRGQNYIMAPIQSVTIERAGSRRRGNFIFQSHFRGRRKR